jgi:adenylyltransferase/sulfurtransferase
MHNAPQISVTELRQLRMEQRAHTLLDVRESWEREIASLPDSLHIPLHEIPERLKELDAGSAIIVVCKVGARSQLAADFLLAQGFSRVVNLRGGMDAWRFEVDPRLPSY